MLDCTNSEFVVIQKSLNTKILIIIKQITATTTYLSTEPDIAINILSTDFSQNC